MFRAIWSATILRYGAGIELLSWSGTGIRIPLRRAEARGPKGAEDCPFHFEDFHPTLACFAPAGSQERRAG